MDYRRVLEQEREEVGDGQPTPKTPPRTELRFGQALGPPTCCFVAREGMEKGGSPGPGGVLVGGQLRNLKRRHYGQSSPSQTLPWGALPAYILPARRQLGSGSRDPNGRQRAPVTLC
jgi:hypothetical protein